jgi:hypothetical protein
MLLRHIDSSRTGSEEQTGKTFTASPSYTLDTGTAASCCKHIVLNVNRCD